MYRKLTLQYRILNNTFLGFSEKAAWLGCSVEQTATPSWSELLLSRQKKSRPLRGRL
jgi:hypothetical protein